MSWPIKVTTEKKWREARDRLDDSDARSFAEIWGMAWPIKYPTMPPSNDHATRRTLEQQWCICLPDLTNPATYALFFIDAAQMVNNPREYVRVGDFPVITVSPAIDAGDRFRGTIVDGVIVPERACTPTTGGAD